MKPAVISALVTACLTIGGAILAVGKDLGEAQARAEFWRQYVEGLPAECRR